MKKNILMLSALILTLTILSSCKKDEKLSDFVLGKWQSQELRVGDGTGLFLTDFKSDACTYTFVVGNVSYEAAPSTYTVDNTLNTITIADPDFSGKKDGDPIIRTFNVEWAPKGRTMTWTPDANSGNDFFVWTRK